MRGASQVGLINPSLASTYDCELESAAVAHAKNCSSNYSTLSSTAANNYVTAESAVRYRVNALEEVCFSISLLH